MADHLGSYNTSSSRTHVRFQFSTNAAAGGNVAPSSAFEAADLRIYRAADGAAFSATQRSSANGITMTSPFDSLTGFHDVDIDLTDNTDSGFYASGYLYSVVLAPDETVDGQTITGAVLAYFEIGPPTVQIAEEGIPADAFVVPSDPSTKPAETDVAGMILWIAGRTGLRTVQRSLTEVIVMKVDGTTAQTVNAYGVAGDVETLSAAVNGP